MPVPRRSLKGHSAPTSTHNSEQSQDESSAGVGGIPSGRSFFRSARFGRELLGAGGYLDVTADLSRMRDPVDGDCVGGLSK